MTPNYKRSILNLANSITAKFGFLPRHDPLPSEILGEKFFKANRVVLLLIDAMGYDAALKVVNEGTFKYLGKPKKLYSVFPSTTVNALTTLATAASPIEHGMLGYVLYLKEFGTLANMIEFSPIAMPRDTLLSRGANPSNFLGVPTIYEQLRNYGVNPLVITANAFKESGLSKTLNHNSAVQGYISMTDMMTKLRKAVESKKFSYIYSYWPMVDAMGHTYGPDSEEYAVEIRGVLRSFEEIVYEKLPSSLIDETVFLIIADHGQLRVDWRHDWTLSADDEFVSTLNVIPSGEQRVLYLYTQNPDKTKEIGINFFKGNVEFHSSEMLLEKGFFGPGKPYKHALERIGNLIAIPKLDHSFTVKYTGSERHLKGKHGGISVQELEIPLFIL